ncbi:hypothetical protein AW736_21310 [Termitidicoccus mucosus]|uniref:Uncharacterized protein n=1 Tax=Termitidicoccus mucosus TaxID=1184151 RepID=A0A178IFW3_9BACT|nr:hypothetical protein AW736_21310 [Opitutaceae bacterium TSB47]
MLFALHLRSVIFAADAPSFAFESRGLSLSDVAGVVGKRYGLSIFFATPEMAARPVHGNLSADSEDDALRVLGFLAGTDYRRQGSVILYGVGVQSWQAVPSGLLTQEQVSRMENASIVGGYALVKGDEITQRNFSDVVERLVSRRSVVAKLLVVDTSGVRADALADLLNHARVDVSLSGPVQSPSFDVVLDFKSILNFLKTDTSSSVLINQEVRLMSGESFNTYNGRVRERPIYVRPEYSESDLVTSYDKTQLGFTFKIDPVCLGDEWLFRYHIEDSDYIEELRRTSFSGVERIREGERKQLVSLRRNMEMKVSRGVPVLRAISKRAFTWATVSSESRSIVVFMEIIKDETADAGRAPARPASDGSSLTLFNNKQ